MSKDKHPKSRWSHGETPRYAADTALAISNKYREQPGWHRGARVTKRTQHK